MMRALVQDMEDLVTSCRRDIPTVFESDDYTHRVEDVMKDVQAKRQTMTNEPELKPARRGLRCL